MTVEAAPAVTPGSTTYRFYVDMLHPTDRMSAVFGNDQATYIETTTSFSSTFNGLLECFRHQRRDPAGVSRPG